MGYGTETTQDYSNNDKIGCYWPWGYEGRLESLASGLHNIGNTEMKEMSLLSNHYIFATTTWIASLT